MSNGLTCCIFLKAWGHRLTYMEPVFVLQFQPLPSLFTSPFPLPPTYDPQLRWAQHHDVFSLCQWFESVIIIFHMKKAILICMHLITSVGIFYRLTQLNLPQEISCLFMHMLLRSQIRWHAQKQPFMIKRMSCIVVCSDITVTNARKQINCKNIASLSSTPLPWLVSIYPVEM